MNVEHLVTMANQIADFFVSEAGSAAAPEQIASHMTRFWDPRMRAQIAAHAGVGGAGLRPEALAAVLRLPPVAARPAAASAGG
jgi:formate dehydrogenase subunit delta